MRKPCLCISLFVLVIAASLLQAEGEHPAQSSRIERDTSRDAPETLIIRAIVRRVLGSRIFTLEDRLAADGEVITLAPDDEATPVVGTTVLAIGVLSRIDDAALKGIPVNDLDERTREALSTRPILIARSVIPGSRQPAAGPSSIPFASRRGQSNESDKSREPLETPLHPAALAELINELGARAVTLPVARVISVLSPRAFLIESASLLPAVNRNFDRVLVFIEGGGLRVDPETIVGTDVRIFGTARTLLGLQASGDVPWPKELTRQILQRFEIRAAVLASSVRTADGVDLIARH